MIWGIDSAITETPKSIKIAQLFVGTFHQRTSQNLILFWQKNYHKVDNFGILSLIQFTEEYQKQVAEFGINDYRFNNGAATLAKVLVKKLLKSTYKIVMEIIQRELTIQPKINEKGHLTTQTPFDLFQVISETNTTSLKNCKSKELALKLLVVAESFTKLYVSHIKQFIVRFCGLVLIFKANQQLSIEVLISICNNTFTFFDLLRSLQEFYIDNNYLTEEEFEANFNLSSVKQ